MTNFAKVLDQLVTTSMRVVKQERKKTRVLKHIIRANLILCIG